MITILRYAVRVTARKRGYIVQAVADIDGSEQWHGTHHHFDTKREAKATAESFNKVLGLNYKPLNVKG